MGWALIRRLTLLWRTFTPVERAILDAVAEAMPPSSRALIRRQIESINFVQRLLDWTAVNLYCRRRGKIAWSAEACFVNDGELELASADYKVSGKNFRTTIWRVGGHIFSLVTRPSIKPYGFEEPTDMTVEIVGDPGVPGPRSPD
jgi:hypothetical protein